MKFLSLSYSKIFFAVPIFALLIFFMFPINLSSDCGEENCPQFRKFIKLTQIGETPANASVNFLFVLLELLLSYLISSIIISISGLGGFMQFLVKK